MLNKNKQNNQDIYHLFVMDIKDWVGQYLAKYWVDNPLKYFFLMNYYKMMFLEHFSTMSINVLHEVDIILDTINRRGIKRIKVLDMFHQWNIKSLVKYVNKWCYIDCTH